MALKCGVICRHRHTPEQLTRTLAFEATRTMRYCELKQAQMVHLGAGMDLARGERFEGIKKTVLPRNETFA